MTCVLNLNESFLRILNVAQIEHLIVNAKRANSKFKLYGFTHFYIYKKKLNNERTSRLTFPTLTFTIQDTKLKLKLMKPRKYF